LVSGKTVTPLLRRIEGMSSLNEIQDVLLLYGTRERHTFQDLEAYRCLHEFPSADREAAFCWALQQDRSELVRFVANLLMTYYRGCKAALPYLRELVLSKDRMVRAAAIAALTAMRDTDPGVAVALRNVRRSGDQILGYYAAGNLLLCHNCRESLSHLKAVSGGDPLAAFCQWFVDEWTCPVRPETASDVGAVREMIGRYGSAEATLVDSLRQGGFIEFAAVATFENEIVGHICFTRMRVESTPRMHGAVLLLPMVIVPEDRGENVDSRLLHEGLRQCGIQFKRAVFSIGQREFLSQFRFNSDLAARFEAPVPDWMVMEMWYGALGDARGRAELPRPVLDYLNRGKN
jgi:putative acetyltransferase